LHPDFGTHDLRPMAFATKILAGHRIAGPDETMQRGKEEFNQEKHGESSHLHYGRGNLLTFRMVLADALEPAPPCETLSKP
jgi:hypothetical protein